jgi:predicted peptidase
MQKSMRGLVAAGIGVLCGTALAGISPEDSLVAQKFLFRTHTSTEITLPYRLFVPEGYDAAKRYPLIMTLHGAGERGTDNVSHIMAHPQAVAWARDTTQAKHPCFVVAPQCPPDLQWVNTPWANGTYSIDAVDESNQLRCVMAILDSLRNEFSIDSSRIYITGISMGGYGTWDAIMRHPDLFAAAVPICGSADTTLAAVLQDLPIWTFHCRDDNAVPVRGTQQMIAAFEELNRIATWTDCQQNSSECDPLTDGEMAALMATAPTLLYSEYATGGHVGSWRGDRRDYDNPYMIEWLLRQQKQFETAVTPQAARVAAVTVGGRRCVSMLSSNKLPAGVDPAVVGCYSLQGKFLGKLSEIRSARAEIDAGVFVMRFVR